jgi:hypothetical protein
MGGLLLFVWLAVSAATAFQPASVAALPQTGAVSPPALPPDVDQLPDLTTFIHQVSSGRPDEIVGLYIPGLAALLVELQQPDEPYSVTDHPLATTLFSDSIFAGSIGLLAHSHLAGQFFSQIPLEQPVILVYGDGHTAAYQVDRLETYQALQPNDPYSQFASLLDGSRWTSQRLFTHIYGSGPNLILQTCLEKDGQSSWGRLFVIAVPAQDLLWKSLMEANHLVALAS